MERQGLKIDQHMLKHWAGLLTTFFIGQGASQVIRLLSGFLIIRWLTKEDYATFTLVLAIQGTMATLVELGFSGGLLALIGSRFQDAKISGRYVAAVQYYRSRLLIFGTVALVGVFYALSLRYEWSLWLTSLLWLSVVSCLCYQAKSSFYTPILELHQKVKVLYQIDVYTSLIRLVILAGAYLLNILSAPVALLVGSLQAFLAASTAKKNATPHVNMPEAGSDIEGEKKELLQLTLPKIAGAVFFAFQAQVTIYLAGIFGQYNQMADLGALSKIGMIFMIPSAFAGMLVVPWFAKQPTSKLLGSYLGANFVYLGFGLITIVLTWFMPGPFLLLLGPGYEGLSYELFLFAVSSALGLLSGLSYLMTSARKWVYYWTAPISIISYVLILVAFLAVADLSKVDQIIMLSICNSFVLVVLHQVVFWIGYRRDKRELLAKQS